MRSCVAKVAGLSCRIALAAAVAAMAPRPAGALWDDQIELFVARSVDRDGNPFRLSDRIDAVPILGGPVLGDWHRTTTAGVSADIRLKAQRLVGDLAIRRERYDRFTSLDHDGHDGRLAWLWRAGDRLDGQIGYGDRQIRGSFSNLQGGIQSYRPNFIETRESFADIGFRVSARFELQGSVSERRQSNSAPELTVSNAHIDSLGLTLSFVARSDNRAGIRYRSVTGRLPVLQPVNGALVDNSYEQRSTTLFVEWAPSEQSRIDLSFGHVSRGYPRSAIAGYSDWEFSAQYVWRPRDRFTLTAVVDNAISEGEEINVGFAVVERLVLMPALRVTEKIDVTAYLEQSDRKYLGFAGAQANGDPVVAAEFRVAGLTVAWRPTARLRLGIGWRAERRDSALPFADYRAGVTTFEARISL